MTMYKTRAQSGSFRETGEAAAAAALYDGDEDKTFTVVASGKSEQTAQGHTRTGMIPRRVAVDHSGIIMAYNMIHIKKQMLLNKSCAATYSRQRIRCRCMI